MLLSKQPCTLKVKIGNSTAWRIESALAAIIAVVNPFLPSNIWVNNKVGGILNSNYTANQMYAALSNFTLTREPGSKFQYSDFGVGLLGYILSLKAGVPYEQLVKDRILVVPIS